MVGSCKLGGLLGAAALALAVTPALGDEPAATATPAPQATPTPIVITNETLKSYADQGSITEVGKPASGRGSPTGRLKVEVPTGPVAPGEATAEEEMRATEQEQYWRSVYQKQIELVAAIEQQIEVLDREIPGLWRDFYSRDDPAYRDGVIKPKLDRALETRQKLDRDREQARERLPKIVEEARRDGATPAWFRGLGKSHKDKGPTPPGPEGSVLTNELEVPVVPVGGS
jgi:hypothetical protein